MSSKYTFGAGEQAARRLETIAAFFDPPAAEFIGSYAAPSMKTAVDLGCGPGFSTAMLLSCFEGADVFGLDSSDDFIAIARRERPKCSFILHDVTRTPFPVSGQVFYARFLLSHLKAPVDLINQWTGELNPGGLLFIDELEYVETEVDVFRRYLDVNEALIASQGADLYVGKALSEGSYAAEVVCNECALLPVRNESAATWFYPNSVSVWEESEFVRECVSSEERKAVSSEIARIRDSGDTREDNTWRMRRLVLRKS